MKKIYQSANYVIVEDGAGNTYQYASGSTAYGRKNIGSVDSFVISETGVGQEIQGQWTIPVSEIVAGDWFDEAGAVAYTESTFTDFIRSTTGFKIAPGGNGVNVGSGTGLIFGGIDSTTGDLEFKSLIAGTNVTITDNPDDITIDASGGGGGSNIATSDLTISSAGTRKLTMAGALSTDIFKLRDSADAFDMFSFGGDGGQAIGWKAENTGTNRWGNTIVGNLAKNNGHFATTVIGSQAYTTSLYGTAVGYQAKAAWNATALGVGANASNGQYNVSIGQSANCTAFFSVAIGRSAVAANNSVAIGGNGTQANGTDSIAIGYNTQNTAGSLRSISIGSQADCTNQNGFAVGYLAQVTGIRAGLINLTSTTHTNAEGESFAINFGYTDHTWRIGATADQWNIGTGSFGYGTMTPDASAVIDLSSTTKGFLPPRMTTTERDAISTPAEGLVVYNATTQVLNFYNGTTWGAV